MGDVQNFIPYHADCVTGGTPNAINRMNRVLSVNTKVINLLSCISRQMILIWSCVTAETDGINVATQ